MSLIYITGVPGSGKSTIQKELVQQGYEAHDIDEPRFGGPVNLKTGEPTIVPPLEERNSKWFEEHEWRVSRNAVEKLKAQSIDKVIFLCGTATTENLIWDLFDKILYLDIDEETLRNRITHRKDNDFGKTANELELILERYTAAKSRIKQLKVVHIDATRPINQIINTIIAST